MLWLLDRPGLAGHRGRTIAKWFQCVIRGFAAIHC